MTQLKKDLFEQILGILGPKIELIVMVVKGS